MICHSTPPRPGSAQFVQRVDSPQSLPVNSYLPGAEINCDHEGSFSRARPFHCTSERLTSMIIPNVDNSGAQFLLVGSSVRADPDNFSDICKGTERSGLDCVFSSQRS